MLRVEVGDRGRMEGAKNVRCARDGSPWEYDPIFVSAPPRNYRCVCKEIVSYKKIDQGPKNITPFRMGGDMLGALPYMDIIAR